MTTPDPSLPAVAEAFAAALDPGLRFEFALDDLDAVGVPVRSAWWRHAGASAGGVGYGDSAARARVGALGETLEAACSVRALGARPRVEGSYAELLRQVGPDGVLDPRTLGLPAGVDHDDDRPLQWLAVRRWRPGAPGDTGGTGGGQDDVLVPAEFVASSGADLPGPGPAPGWLTVPVTNGQGAGSTFDQAVTHGLLEVLQRDGNGLTFRALDRGAEVQLPEQVADGATRDALAALRSAGVEVIVKVGSTDLGLPNVYVVGSAPGDDLVTATACGEAVHPDRTVALRKAVLEFASARARKRFMHGPLDAVRATAPPGYLEDALQVLDPAQEEQRVLDATVHWLQAGPAPDGSGDDGSAIWRRLQETVFSRRSRTPFDALPTTEVTAADLPADVAGRLAAQGFEVLVADPSPLPDASGPGGAAVAGSVPDRSVHGGPGVHAAKVIVPGTEVETVAYGRIGERNVRRLLDEGRDDLVRVGDGPAGWSRVHLTAAAQERLGGPAWLDRRRLAELTEDLLPLYREPSRHVAQLALR